MLMPTDEDLDKMALKLTGHPFAAQPTPNEKAKIMDLCLKAELNHIADSILENIGSIVTDTTETKEKFIQIADDVGIVGDWFKHSKLWDGL